jgi:hypothetical protein
MIKSSGFGARTAYTPAEPNLRNRIEALSVTSPLSSKVDEVRVAIDSSNPNKAIEALTKTLLPLAELPQAMKITTKELAQINDEIRNGFVILTSALQRQPRVPSLLAFRVLARLSQVRDALCDQTPSKGTANSRLQSELKANSTKELLGTLSSSGYGNLAAQFRAQFSDLKNDSEVASEERRTRLAELMSFEWQIAAAVEDQPASSLSKPA